MRFEEMKKDGLNPKDIKYCVNTHCHPDHFEGSLDFAAKNIPLGMHEEEIAFYNKLGPQFFQMFGMTFPKLEFSLVMKEGVWNVAGTDLEIYHTPGHSPGSICIYWKEKKTLVCGDVVFEQSVGRVDFPGGDGNKLIESIKRISKLEIEHLLPGHMNIISGEKAVKKNFEMIENYYFSMM